MSFHRNAKLGLAGRYALVSAIEDGHVAEGGRGRFQRLAGDRASLVASLAGGGEEARATLSCLFDRSSRPHRSPRQLAAELAEPICALPPRDRLGAAAGRRRDRLRHSTVWKVLQRAGLSRPPRQPREPANRYEWPCPGDLLHMDTSEYARFQRPGHRVTGDRSQPGPQHRDGIDFVARDHRRPLPARLRRDPRRPESRHRRRLPRARARLLRRATASPPSG